MHRGGYSESDALNDGIEAEEIILDQLPEPEQESEEDMATGDKLVNLDDLKVAYDKQQEDTNALRNALKTESLFVEQGVIISSGVDSDSTTRIRTSFFKIPSSLTITINSGYKARMYTYKSDFSFNTVTEWSTSNFTVTNTERYFRIVIGRTNDSVIDVDEFTNAVTVNFTGCEFYLIQNTVEENLTKNNKQIDTNKNDIANIETEIGILNTTALETNDLYVENGTINTLGKENDDSTRIRTSFLKIPSSLTITVNNGYKARLLKYNNEFSYLSIDDWSTTTISVLSTTAYYRLVIARSDNAEINTDEYENAISADFTGCKYYLLQNTVADTLNKFGSISGINGKVNALVSVQPNYAEYGSISTSTGAPTQVANRIRSGYLKPLSTPVTITAKTGYVFNYIVYDDDLNKISADARQTSLTINESDNRLYRFVVIKGTDEAIEPSDFTNAFTNSFEDFACFGTLADLNEIRKMSEPDQFSLNINLTDLTSMVWEYQNWVFPQVISYNRIRNSLFFTFANKAGYSGIARYDYDTELTTKTYLKKNTFADDHNLIAVLMMSNHKLLCSYSGGHNTDRFIYIRIADSEESIESFGSAIRLESSELTSYSQLFEYDGKIFLFYRTGNNGWSYRISSDYGVTWTGETKLVQASHQYYCQFTETTTDGVLKMCCYSNPEQNDTNIRMAYLHLDNMTLYDTDNTTVIGTTAITPSEITIVIPITTGKLNRLFNAAKTAIGDNKILYCIFSGDQSSDGEYYVYDNGNSYKIADAGYSLWVPKAQLGVAWIGTSQIAVARGYEGKDLIEIYDYSNGTVSFNRLVAEKARGDYGIRTARPMVDNNQKSLVYIQGYFDPSSFYNFTMDAHIYNLY